MIRFLALRLGLTLAGLAALVAVGLLGYPALRRALDNPGYADKVFAGLLRYDRVLASRQWHGWGAEAWDCSFAIVALGDSAPPQPASDGQMDDRGWQFVYGGDWQETPVPPLGDTTRDALDFCAQYWDPDLAGRLDRALAQPGSWFIRDGVGETVHIYSAPERVAARIRFGD